MANATANINVEVNGLGKLDTLDKKLQGLSGKFSGLKSALAGVGFAAFARQAAVAADEVIDLSNASGIAVGRLLELQGAIEEAGGKAGAMSAAVGKFALSIDEAAQGSLKLQSTFQELGISLSDLGTLTEADLLAKTVNEIGKITDKSRQASLMMDLFGKSMKGVDINKLRSELEASGGTMDKYAQSLQQASDLNGKLDRTLMNLNIAFLKVTEPLVEMINKIVEGGQNIDRLVTIIKTLGVVLLAVFGGGVAMVVIRFFGMIMRGFAAIGPAVAQVGKYFSSFGTTAAAGAEKAALSFAANGKLMTALRGVGALIGSVGAGIAGFMGLGGAGDAKPEATGTPSAGAGGAESAATREVTDALAKKRQEIQNVTKAFKDQSNQIIDNINVEKMLIGKSQEESDVIRAQEEIYKRAAAESEKLRVAKNALGNDEKGLTAVYDAQIKKIQEQAEVDVQRVTTAVNGLNGLKLLEQDRLNNIERINQALQKQIAYDQSLLQIRQQTEGILSEVEFQGAQMRRSPLERQFASIQENARKAALEASRAFSEQFNMEDMGAEDAKKLADGLALIAQRYQDIANIQSANLSQSRTWAEGWKTAFDSYMENSTNAARVAGDAFTAFTSNMNSAIDNFVTSGKFSFGDFARSVIQDLIKIELKAQASKLLSGISSGIGGFFSSLLGFADGGQPPINKPSIVGEKGPELFVPKTAGTIIPNGGLSGSGMGASVSNTYITNNISAMDAKSVAQLFAENRRTLFGTVEMARKELSYGR
jgi:lambda family phage tail tape measure protein